MENQCLIIEDHQSTQEFLKDAIGTAFPKLTIHVAASLREAEKFLDEDLELALVDIGLPDGSGIEFIRNMARKNPNTKSIVVTMHAQDKHLFEALAAGAYGYLLKEDDRQLVIHTLRRLEQNEPPLSPSIAHKLLNHFRKTTPAVEEEVTLTSREKETLSLIAHGYTVVETAIKMGLSAQTVAGYIKIIYQKLHISSRAEATREAIRRGLA